MDIKEIAERVSKRIYVEDGLLLSKFISEKFAESLIAEIAKQNEPVESEPAMWVMKHIRSGDLAQAKPNQKALHQRMWSQAHIYTTPQPDRVAELEAALKVARDGIDEFLVANDPTEFGCACDLSVGYLCGPCHADKQQQPLKSALAKINEVLHD